MLDGHVTYLLCQKALQKEEWYICKVFFIMAILPSTIRECIFYDQDNIERKADAAHQAANFDTT